MAWGSPEKKLSTGGPRGMAGAVADRRWGVFLRRAGPVVAGGSGGVEVEDEPQTLDFVSNGCKID